MDPEIPNLLEYDNLQNYPWLSPWLTAPGWWLSSKMLPCCLQVTLICAMPAKPPLHCRQISLAILKYAYEPMTPVELAGLCEHQHPSRVYQRQQKVLSIKKDIDKGRKEDHPDFREHSVPLTHISGIKTQWCPIDLHPRETWFQKCSSDKLIPWLVAGNSFHTALTRVPLDDNCATTVLSAGRRCCRTVATLALASSCSSRPKKRDAVRRPLVRPSHPESK